MEFERLYAPSLKELFVQQLQDRILSGDLPMGTKLPPERELCQQMRVSRAVVNSGVTELARQGFLEIRPRQGTYVADYRRNGNLDTLVAIMHYNGEILGKDEIRSILEVRWGLEQIAVSRAIDYASDEELEKLWEAVEELGTLPPPTPARAAEIAYVTPQCLSDHVKRIEETYGVTLFIRKPHLRLTEEGRTMVRYLTRIRALEDSMENELADVSGGARGTLRLGLPVTRGSILIPQTVTKFREHFPNVEVEIRLSDTRNLEELLLGGALDLFLGVDAG